MFRKVVKLCPEMSVMFVSSLVRACFTNISAMSFADVEVSLYLLGLLSDASTQVGTVVPLSSSVVSLRVAQTTSPSRAGAVCATDSRFFSEMLVALVSSGKPTSPGYHGKPTQSN